MKKGANGFWGPVLVDQRQALEKAQNGNGQLLEKVGMDLGLAPRPLGFGATSIWGWRRAGLAIDEDHADSQRYESLGERRGVIALPSSRVRA